MSVDAILPSPGIHSPSAGLPVLEGKETTARGVCLLSIDDAAQQLGVGVRFLRRLVDERRIRFFKIGRHLRFLSTDLQEFIAAGAVEPLPTRRGQ